MEPQSTIFILGAGSSKPYGMPLGYEINHFIVELSKSFSLNSRWKKMNPLVKKLIKIATEVKFQKGELKRFSDSLRKSNISSIDKFLDMRDDDFKYLGKHIIAFLLLEFEKENNLYFNESGDDWIGYLWNKFLIREKEGAKSRINVQILYRKNTKF